ncbi:MAG: hypothetical protein NTY33_00390 [Candidatus Moranbacteria bacterium]|nr:hypothetical protein [Candidatus Moranbacteria bacterium]
MKNNEKVRHFEYKKSSANDFKKALIRIGVSKRFGGIGVFAVRNLKKGQMIADVDLMREELFFPWKEFEKIDKESREMISAFCAESAEGFYAPRDINHISIPWHMNHCCDGNIGFDSQGNFVTIKNVKAGDELCYDYGFVKTNPKFRLKCKCKSKNCRKIITGDDWKNLEYRKKNIRHMSPDVIELIQKEG